MRMSGADPASRSPPALEYRIFVPRTLDFTRDSSISVSATLKRSLTSISFGKTQSAFPGHGSISCKWSWLTQCRIFYSIAKDILPTTNRYSPTHAFIRLLQEKDKLLTNYSQNIDDLESKAGILPEKLIQCHGSFATASCLTCRHRVRGHEIFSELREGKLAYCSRCKETSTEGSRKRKRGLQDGSTGNARKRRHREYSESDEEEDDDDDGDKHFAIMKAGLLISTPQFG